MGNAGHHPGGERSWRWCLGAVALISCAYAIWPGDAPFSFDEPLLIGKAMRANAAHALAATGLHGTKGITYSALPVWIYQAMLLISHDLRVIVAIRAMLCAAAVGLSLLWLAKNLELPCWFAPVVLLSPTLWFFCRQLWDNTFCIPLSSLALASYVQFLRAPSRGAIALCLGSLLAMLLIHLMSLPLAAAIGIHALVFHRRELLRQWRVLLLEIIIAGAIAIPWLRTIFEGEGADIGTGADGWWFPFLGARTISGAHLGYIFGDLPASAGGAVGLVVRVAMYISLLAYPLMWAGIGVAGSRVAQFVGRKRSPELLDQVSIVLLGALAVQVVMYGIGHIYGLPHYYNGAWIIYPMLAWLGIDLLRAVRLSNIVIVAQGASLLVLLFFLAWRIHQGGGIANGFYGPSIQVRMNVIAVLNARGWRGPFAFVRAGSDQYVVDPLNTDVPLTPIVTDVPSFLTYPVSMNVIQELISPGQPAAQPAGSTGQIHIQLSDPRRLRCDMDIFER